MNTLIITLTLAITTSAAGAFEEQFVAPAALGLPVIEDAGWDLLETAEAREVGADANWHVEKNFPEELRAAADDFTISGYLVPITAQAYLKDLMLVRDPADCPFCGGAGYGPVLEVSLKRAVPEIAEFSRITLQGRLELLEASDTTQLYRLTDARIQ